jgi:hypothetical protein
MLGKSSAAFRTLFSIHGVNHAKTGDDRLRPVGCGPGSGLWRIFFRRCRHAKEAEGKMKALEERGKALEKKMKEFPKEKLDALGKKYESEGKAAADRVGKAVMNAMMKGIKLGPKGLGGP